MRLAYNLQIAFIEKGETNSRFLAKGADEETYKKFAQHGMDLMFPVSIKGKTHREDINIPYHTTVKLFDPSKDKTEHVHDVASKLHLDPPDPRSVRIEPTTLKGRGYTAHVIRLHGPHSEQMKEHHKKFSHLGYKENYDFHPHITVDKPTWDKIVASKATNAHEAGIQFHNAELRHGKNNLASYGKDQKLAASERLDKGAFKHIGAALGIAAGVAMHSPSAAAPTANSQAPKYSSSKMLNTIAQVESSGGKMENHKPLGGMHHGESAYGKYGLTPQVIRETIKLNPDLAKYKKATMLHGNDMHHFMQDNPGLEDTVAAKHLSRLEHHFGQNPEKLGFAWLEGIRGTYNAEKTKKDISSHWHVKKIKNAYLKGK